MTDFPHQREQWVSQPSVEDWLVAIATALVVLLFLGVLPHVNW